MEKEFIQTVDTYQRIIHKISRMYRDTKEDQEDLFQEIVFQLWKSYPSFRNDSKISTWIYRIALNTAIASFRKKRVTMHSDDDIPENLHPITTNKFSDNEELLIWALKQLNDSEKAIISLYLEGYSYDETASIIGITENYVGVQINRIKNKLKVILNK